MTKRQRGILAATGLGLFLVFLDAMIANLALPDIQDQFGGGESTMQWIVVAYSVGMAIGIMPSGTLADRYGRKIMFLASVILFSLASLASGLAPSIWVIVLARGIQGLAAASVSVTSLAIVSAEFDEPKLKAKAIGIWNGIAAGGLAVGPILGGVLTQEVGWRAVFLISVPVGILVVLLALPFIKESKNPKNTNFDFGGQLFFAISIVSLSISVIMGPHVGWLSPLIISTAALFIVGLLTFIKYENKQNNPMMDLSLFKDKIYSWAIASIFAIFFLVYGSLLLVTQYWQNIKDYSPIETGLLLLPFAIGMILLPPRTGKYVAEVGPIKPAKIGLYISIVAAVLLILSIHFDILTAIGFGMFGVGVAFAGPALTTLAMSSVSKERAGMASGIFSAQRAIGSTVGYAVIGSVLAAWLGATLVSDLNTILPENESEAAANSIIENANPHAFSAEIGPGEPIPSNITLDDDILNIAKTDFIDGMQVSLAVGSVLLLATIVVGQRKIFKSS